MKMVGDPTRFKICYHLCRHKEFSVGDIAEVLGVSLSTISHTLRKLQKADMVGEPPLVEVMKDGIKHYENI